MIESTTFYSFTYNLMAFGVAFLVTTTQRTASARLVLFVLIIVCVFFERTVYSSEMEASESSLEYTERVYSQVWGLRKLAALTGVLVLAYCIAAYQDVGRQTLELLRSVRESQNRLQRTIEEAAPHLVPARGQWQPATLTDVELDSGIGDPKVEGEECPSSGPAPPPPEYAVYRTSTPKKTGARSPSRSTARRRDARRSEVSVYNILVSESPSKYNLRQRKSSESGPAT
ncbi:uncharacterized protein [Scyliorhinus torazame]|uniref:uncharacterized protein n=1 Tax=Scyliorhinus torazame TaxID=75743 RepID=UPI003B5BD5AA